MREDIDRLEAAILAALSLPYIASGGTKKHGDGLRALKALADRASAAENALRREWWLNHGCPTGSVYGDDGEMSCGSCATDFKRTPFEDLRQRVVANRTLRARAALASRPAGEETQG